MSKKTYYPDVVSSPDFPKIEEDILKFWEREGVFAASVEGRDAALNNLNNEFIFYDGPPFANGLPHYGHLLTSCVKDIYARYQTMKGKRVERRFGWDCHGLPAEMASEKELGISGRMAIEEYGVDKFNDHCRESVMKYTGEWESYINRMARWVDFENDYKTMDTDYMESVLWAFKQLYDKGLVYESHRVMPYSWAAETPLSNFETRMDDSYREREDKAITVAFRLKDVPEGAPDGCDNYYLLAWTTTPWTLPSNLALAVGEEMEYVCVTVDSSPLPSGGGEVAAQQVCYILAKSALNNYGKELGRSKEVLIKGAARLEGDKLIIPKEEMSFGGVCPIRGSSLVGLSYEPLFPYFEDAPNAFKVLAGDFVEEGSGTGIVHLAPGFGEDDQRVCADNDIKVICPVDEKGCYTNEIFDIKESGLVSPASLEPAEGSSPSASKEASGGQLKLKGLNVIEATEKCDDEPYTDEQMRKSGLANLRIINYLKHTGQLIKQESYKHNYPHCWRTDKPLIYKAVPSWYVEVTKIKDRMVELNQNINWIPDHIKDGQFGKWLENARDWSISRNRFWGTPIPIWKSDSGKIKVFGSIEELEDFFLTHMSEEQIAALVESGGIDFVGGQESGLVSTASLEPAEGSSPSASKRASRGQYKIKDLHKPFIDDLAAEFEGETYRRVPDVFDCWFESGSMPFAQVHYPFENKDWFDGHFPADFIVEYVAQTRGWFYTLMVLSTALFDREPFKNCICHGVILSEQTDEFGRHKKLSKRHKNYADPVEMFDTYGADAMRWFLVSGTIMHGGELIVSGDGGDIRDVVRLSIKPIWNAYNFFTLYANADGIEARLIGDSAPTNLMDRYILAKCKQAVLAIEKAMDTYDTPTACKAVQDFFEVLNNWYIRRNRERFWRAIEGEGNINEGSMSGSALSFPHREGKEAEAGGNINNKDKQAAYDTLYSVLHIISRAAAPLLPLTLESVWQGLNGKAKGSGLASPASLEPAEGSSPSASKQASGGQCKEFINSVHLANFPNVSSISDEADLVADMDRVRDACNAALGIRNQENIRIRQPLAGAKFIGVGKSGLGAELNSLIADEINVKIEGIEAMDAGQIRDYAILKLQINFPIVGKRLGAKMKAIAGAAKQGQWQADGDRIIIGEEILEPGEFEIKLEPKPDIKGAQALSTNDAMVVLDLEITPELKAEGIARDVVRMVQQARRDADFHISDNIRLSLDISGEVVQAVESNRDYVTEQTLASELKVGSVSGLEFTCENTLEGRPIKIGLTKVA